MAAPYKALLIRIATFLHIMSLEYHTDDSSDSDSDSDTVERSPSPLSVHEDEFPGDRSAASVPADLKTEGDDWFVLYNHSVPRSLDISLIYDFSHTSVVCCVRFSKDGMRLASGCNRTTQIFDLSTGSIVSILDDQTVSQEGDLYIRAVCFSPDGKLVATAAEDRLVRVGRSPCTVQILSSV